MNSIQLDCPTCSNGILRHQLLSFVIRHTHRQRNACGTITNYILVKLISIDQNCDSSCVSTLSGDAPRAQAVRWTMTAIDTIFNYLFHRRKFHFRNQRFFSSRGERKRANGILIEEAIWHLVELFEARTNSFEARVSAWSSRACVDVNASTARVSINC